MFWVTKFKICEERRIIHWVRKMFAKCDMGESGWELIYFLVEITAKSENKERRWEGVHRLINLYPNVRWVRVDGRWSTC
jgi:hypothetical protein